MYLTKGKNKQKYARFNLTNNDIMITSGHVDILNTVIVI